MVPEEIEPHLGLSGLFSNQTGELGYPPMAFLISFYLLNKKIYIRKFCHDPFSYNNSGNNFDYIKKCIKWSIDFNSNNFGIKSL